MIMLNVEDVELLELSYIAAGSYLTVSSKVKKYLSWDPAIQLPGIYPRELKTYVHNVLTYKHVHSSFTYNGKNT